MRDLQALIGTDQLAAGLGDPALRVFDCTTILQPVPPGSDVPYRVVPARSAFEASHIPGADFLDLQGEFSDPATPLRLMLAPVPQLEAAFGRHGVGPGARVVLYSTGSMIWATRIWWTLRALGFAAAVLDGGLDKWTAEGKPTEAGPAKGYPPATFHAALRPGLFVGKEAVLAALGRPGTAIVNALGADLHKGEGPSRYGRPGHIPGSVNIPAATLVDSATKAFPPLADVQARFATNGVTRDKQVICYCGGGIAATLDLFLLHQLGYDDIALYDASMGEWAKDASLPIETG